MSGIDIVIPLGTGSLHDDFELRYCLRSVEHYMFSYRNIYIVGEKPAWLTNVIHIPHPDDQQKELNIRNKILAACAVHDLSYNFFFMNDDHFILKPTSTFAYFYYHKGELADTLQSRERRGLTSGYYQTLHNTYQTLCEWNLPSKNFDIHTPIVYSKVQFKNIATALPDAWNLPGSLAIKSIYCNFYGIEGTELEECRINRPMTVAQIQQRVQGRPVFSIGDEGLTPMMKQFLTEQFPKPSKYEQ